MVRNERPGPTGGLPPADSRVWTYLGVGCLTAAVGLVGGGMIAVLVAKIVGAIQGCTPDAETGAPCRWSEYWTWGARIGLVLLPILALRRLRSRESESENTERG